MRIRSIKPEFWRSSDISKLSIEDRLLFVGLWSYVDDNGVGIDKLAAIAADLFADDIEQDAPETFARVSRGLRNLSEGGRIVRYTVDGAQYLAIVNWGKHQRIDKPGKPRFPRPDAENASIRESVARVPEKVAPGTGEQGNSGTGDKESDPGKPDARTPEHRATDDAYEKTGKAFNFIATRQIAKWAINDRAKTEAEVSEAIVTAYNAGKPITKTVLGQYFDGIQRQAQSKPTTMDRMQQTALLGMELQEQATNYPQIGA